MNPLMEVDLISFDPRFWIEAVVPTPVVELPTYHEVYGRPNVVEKTAFACHGERYGQILSAEQRRVVAAVSPHCGVVEADSAIDLNLPQILQYKFRRA